MGEEGAVHVSIRQMVEFICRGGDLASRGFSGPERALEGTRIHQKLQKSRSSAYRSEVPMLLAVSLTDGLCLEVEGRADGVEELDRIWKLPAVSKRSSQPMRPRSIWAFHMSPRTADSFCVMDIFCANRKDMPLFG